MQQRTSTAIECIFTNLIDGCVSVMFNNGAVYRYSNVSRRAIANLHLQKNISFGFWVNANCIKPKRVKCVKLYNAIPTVDGWAS